MNFETNTTNLSYRRGSGRRTPAQSYATPIPRGNNHTSVPSSAQDVANTPSPPVPGPSGFLGLPWEFWTGGQARRLMELTQASDGWRPTRTRFEADWPEGELETEWYEQAYTQLYERVRAFVGASFGGGDFEDVEFGGWGGLSSELVRLIGEIATQDDNAGGWDGLLVKGVNRECLVTGVVGKVLETCVFDKLLFGADEMQRTMLEAQDECTLDSDGYRRTALRSSCVRSIMADAILTPEFWFCVDELALQLTTLLLPLIQAMDKHFGQVKPLRSIYQDLHDIVAQAGYLGIGIRLSRNVFRFSLPDPGEQWSRDQQQADDSVFKASELANNTADDAAEVASEMWRAEHSRKQQEEAMQSDAHSPLQDWQRPLRCGKVQIILWPGLQRFAAVGEMQEDGEEVTTILKSQVVYYYGLSDEPEDGSEDSPGLDGWLRQKRRERMWDWLSSNHRVWEVVAMWVFVSYLCRSVAYPGRQTDGPVNTAKQVLWATVLFPGNMVARAIGLCTGAFNFILLSVYFARDLSAWLFGFGGILPV